MNDVNGTEGRECRSGMKMVPRLGFCCVRARYVPGCELLHSLSFYALFKIYTKVFAV